MSHDTDKPVTECKACGAGVWQSMLSKNWIASCWCKDTIDSCKKHNKQFESKSSKSKR